MRYLYTCTEGHTTEVMQSVGDRWAQVACRICGNPARRDFRAEMQTQTLHVPLFFHKTAFKSKEEEEGTYGGRWV